MTCGKSDVSNVVSCDSDVFEIMLRVSRLIFCSAISQSCFGLHGCLVLCRYRCNQMTIVIREL